MTNDAIPGPTHRLNAVSIMHLSALQRVAVAMLVLGILWAGVWWATT